MRSQAVFFRISSLVAICVVFGLAVTGFGGVQANPAEQATAAGTMMATMSSEGAIPPCPQPMMAATLSATMQATAAMSGMAATMSMTTAPAAATMAPTMFVAPSGSMSGCELTATLLGTNEVPNPGDPNGKGTAVVVISRPDTGPGEICFSIQVSGIKLPASASHIHSGAMGVPGPVIVPFKAPDANGNSVGCTENVDRALISAILSQPGNYYVNVHNTDFPNGAMRGQLTPATQ